MDRSEQKSSKSRSTRMLNSFSKNLGTRTNLSLRTTTKSKYKKRPPFTKYLSPTVHPHSLGSTHLSPSHTKPNSQAHAETSGSAHL